MRNLILFSLLFITLSSCDKPQKGYVIVKGEIKGMTDGTLLLQKVKNDQVVTVDSFQVVQDGKFEMKNRIKSPEIYYLRLKKFQLDYILFFAEEGVITIDTHLEKFASAAKVKGSKNHDLWTDYKKMISKFNDERLVLIRDNLMAEKDKNYTKIDSIDKVFKNHVKRRYLYTANYAVKHADMEIAPYLALTELYDANLYFLDTIEKSMNEKTRNSMYGEKFLEFLAKVKKSEVDTANTISTEK